MRTFINCIHLIILPLLTLFINTSWTANIKTNEDLLGGILQTNHQDGKILANEISKQVDLRISNKIAENVLSFGHNLGIKLAASEAQATRSEIFSPLNIMAALSMLALGAKGESYEELKQILGLNSDSDIIQNPNKYHEQFGLMLYDLQHSNLNGGGANTRRRPNANWRDTKTLTPSIRRLNPTEEPVEHIVKVANGLFVQKDYTLNPDYSQVLQSIYETQVTKLDFRTRSREATDYINGWVNKATFGKISRLMTDNFDASTKIVLVSALYFKAVWETFFFKGTNEENFYPDGVNSPAIKAEMMRNAGIFPFYDAREYGCRIIGLPYKDNETTMYVIQPNDSSRQKLRDLQHVLDAYKINAMIDKMERKTTIMLFPKMRFTRRLKMKEILIAMNVTAIFRNGLPLIGKRLQAELIKEQTIPESVPVPFELIYRSKPVYQGPIIFSSRFGDTSNTNNSNSFTKNDTINQTEILSTTEKTLRRKRNFSNYPSDPVSLALLNLESNRQKVDSHRSDHQKADSYTSDLYVDEILHNVDFSVDEKGTEAAAATSAILLKTGTDVIFRGDTPFLIVIRHDPTKLPLFYGIINKPEL